jgi:phospholipid/cholesterol/gamma-HCH transport system permease protein
MTGTDGQIAADEAVRGIGGRSGSVTLTSDRENTAPLTIGRHHAAVVTPEPPRVAPKESVRRPVLIPARTRLSKRLTKVSSSAASKPLRSLGDFFAMSLDTLLLMFKPPFAWREYLLQTWFVARVSIAPTLMLTIPYTVLLVFTFNILLIEFGAADFSGTGAAYGSVTQLGPVVTVLVVAGAGATAMCADLGARTIREELDALRVMGIDPIQALVVPRVLAATTVALALSSTVILVGLGGGYLFCVYVQHVSPGAFVSGMTLITGAKDVVIALIKAGIFGLAAGLIACYKGISVGGGPAGVGNAVNETVVFTFMALFAINVIATAVGVQATI